MALITIDEYKNYKNINSDEKDTKLSLILNAVNDYIINYCGRTFTDYVSTYKTEYFEGNNKYIYVSEYPLLFVNSVKISSDGGITQTTWVENTDYFVDLDKDRIISVGENFINSYITFRNVEIKYKGGYHKIPHDLKIAMLDLMAYYNKEEFVPSRTMNNASMIHISSEDAIKIPVHIRRILDNYRVV